MNIDVHLIYRVCIVGHAHTQVVQFLTSLKKHYKYFCTHKPQYAMQLDNLENLINGGTKG